MRSAELRFTMFGTKYSFRFVFLVHAIPDLNCFYLNFGDKYKSATYDKL
jgi:hypothetical protein